MTPKVPFWLYSPANKRRHKPHPMTIDRRERILVLWAAGNTIETIAYICSLSRDAVSDHLAAGRKVGDPRAQLRSRKTINANTKKASTT